MSSAAFARVQARVRRHFTLETAVHPHTLLLAGAGISFLAWVIPWGGAIPASLRGFAHEEPWTLHGTLFVLSWYAFFFGVALGGYLLGRRIPVLQRAERVPWESYYLFLSIAALAGTAYSYAYVFAKSPHAISDAFLHQQFNEVRKVLPYSAGPQTLRYASSLSGAIAIFELGRGRFRLLHVVNVLLLLFSAAIASRASLIIAAIVVAGLTARHLHTAGVRARKVVAVLLLGLVGLFLALSLLNYSRNADFYRSYRVRNPLVMNLDEMVRYLGIPFQATVAVSNHVSTWPAAPRSAAAGTRVFLLPSYAGKNQPASVTRGENRYRALVAIPASQTTNSVLASTYGVFGALAFPILGLIVLVVCIVAGHAFRYRSYAFLAGLVVAYCLSEWWRTYIINQGIVQFLIFAVAVWAVAGASVDSWTGGRWSRLTEALVGERHLREQQQAPPQT
jgi:hypothetical protein